jgi:hypothetical protein
MKTTLKTLLMGLLLLPGLITLTDENNLDLYKIDPFLTAHKSGSTTNLTIKSDPNNVNATIEATDSSLNMYASSTNGKYYKINTDASNIIGHVKTTKGTDKSPIPYKSIAEMLDTSGGQNCSKNLFESQLFYSFKGNTIDHPYKNKDGSYINNIKIISDLGFRSSHFKDAILTFDLYIPVHGEEITSDEYNAAKSA